LTILIVDDNVAMRGMIRSLLSGKKYQCHECSDGSSALRQYDLVHPDVVLMDVAMKPMDGITATRLMKQQHPEAKVVVITDYGDRRTQEAARAAGADGFVKKEDLMIVNAVLKKLAG
jgi:CheY-like chemotaxis protein